MQPDSKTGGTPETVPERAAFFRAVHDGDTNYLEMFLALNPDAVTWKTPDGTPMMVLAVGAYDRDLYSDGSSYRQRETMALLMSYGADVEAKDAQGRTALLEICFNNQQEDIIAMLLMKGADVNTSDNTKTTPLHVLAKRDWGEDLIAVIARAGGKLDAQDWLGNTPLHIAAGESGLEFTPGHQEAVRKLLALGASPDIKNNNQRTPLDSANMNGDFIAEEGKRPTADIIQSVLDTRPKPKLPRLPKPEDKKSDGTGSKTPDPRLPLPPKNKFKLPKGPGV